MTLRKSIPLLGAALAVVAVAASAAPAPIANAITTRQANFKRMGAAMKLIKDQLASGSPAKPAIVNAANTIAQTARGQGALFPAGSGPSSGVKTDALPLIWTSRATFDQQMNAMVGEAGRLVAAANAGDMAAVDLQYRAVGRSCGACHRQYRVEQ